MANTEYITTGTDADIHPEVAVYPEPPLVKNLLKTARPKQWVKNVLVLAAPAAGARLTDLHVLGLAAEAFVAFLLASIGTYFINDALDHQADRLHPKKRWRPIAAGWLSLRLAWAVGAGSLTTGLGVAFLLINAKLGFLIAGYVLMTLAYGLWLKHMPIVDLVVVAAGFILRMIAGGIATDIVISEWFLTVASFSSLFVVAGKRYGEVRAMGTGNSSTRAVLDEYTPGFLRAAWTMAMTVSIAAYMQWSFATGGEADNGVWYQLSAIPWVMAMLRYGLILDRGEGGAPEDVLAHDRTIQVFGAIWLVLWVVGVYAS